MVRIEMLRHGLIVPFMKHTARYLVLVAQMQERRRPGQVRDVASAVRRTVVQTHPSTLGSSDESEG